MRHVRTLFHRQQFKRTYLQGSRVGNSKLSGKSSSKLTVLGTTGGRQTFTRVEGKALASVGGGTNTDAIVSDLDLDGRGTGMIGWE